MMALDSLNNLNEWPLKNIDFFIEECKKHNINDINITGSNTDPLLYRYTEQLLKYIRTNIPNAKIGLRTNGVLALQYKNYWLAYDKASISITSFDPDLYIKTMGMGTPPNIEKIVALDPNKDLKINIVLCPETVDSGDVFQTLDLLRRLGIKRVNLREPYGQPRVGNPMNGYTIPTSILLGMPSYNWGGMVVTYWDVHYVEVESVNLYANGIVSTTYPVSKGHCPTTGKVLGQEHFIKSGRVIKQWNYERA